MDAALNATRHQPDSRYAMARLAVTMLLMTVGSSGMYVVSVVLPAVQAEFGVARADASLPYTALMIGFGIGGVLMGKLADRVGVMWPLAAAKETPLGLLGLETGSIVQGRSSVVPQSRLGSKAPMN